MEWSYSHAKSISNLVAAESFCPKLLNLLYSLRGKFDASAPRGRAGIRHRHGFSISSRVATHAAGLLYDLLRQTLWAEKIPSTTDVASLNIFGRNEIEVAPISSALRRIACLVILYKTCRVPDQELAADGCIRTGMSTR